MAKSSMKPEYDALEQAILETFLAGHKEARPDLPYPQSHSDMQSGIRALLVMFEIKRRPIALAWKDLFSKTTPESSVNDWPNQVWCIMPSRHPIDASGKCVKCHRTLTDLREVSQCGEPDV